MTTFIMVGMIVVAPKAIAAIGPKKTLVTGMTILTAGLAGLSLIRSDGSFWADVLPASLIAAAGMSLAFIPSLGIALSSARPEEGGLASGIVNTSYQIGSALGLAAMTAVAAANGADQLGDADLAHRRVLRRLHRRSRHRRSRCRACRDQPADPKRPCTAGAGQFGRRSDESVNCARPEGGSCSSPRGGRLHCDLSGCR